MEGFLPIFFLGVVLKIPIFAGLYLIYWAVRAEPELDVVADDGDHGFRRWRVDPERPRGPRRGPHAPDAQPLPDCPPGGRLRTPRPALAPAARGRESEVRDVGRALD